MTNLSSHNLFDFADRISLAQVVVGDVRDRLALFIRKLLSSNLSFTAISAHLILSGLINTDGVRTEKRETIT